MNYLAIGSRFKIYDFYQVDVDDFADGRFRYHGLTEVKNPKWDQQYCQPIEKGWMLEVFSYTNRQIEKYLICDYWTNPNKNSYECKRKISELNECNDLIYSSEGILGFADMILPMNHSK